MDFHANGTVFAFFEAEEPASVYYIDCCSIHCHISLQFFLKCAKRCLESAVQTRFRSAVSMHGDPSCAKLFHVQFLVQNVTDALFWHPYIISNFT